MGCSVIWEQAENPPVLLEEAGTFMAPSSAASLSIVLVECSDFCRQDGSHVLFVCLWSAGLGHWGRDGLGGLDTGQQKEALIRFLLFSDTVSSPSPIWPCLVTPHVPFVPPRSEIARHGFLVEETRLQQLSQGHGGRWGQNWT